jgi:hypothetical protein
MAETATVYREPVASETAVGHPEPMASETTTAKTVTSAAKATAMASATTTTASTAAPCERDCTGRCCRRYAEHDGRSCCNHLFAHFSKLLMFRWLDMESLSTTDVLVLPSLVRICPNLAGKKSKWSSAPGTRKRALNRTHLIEEFWHAMVFDLVAGDWWPADRDPMHFEVDRGDRTTK